MSFTPRRDPLHEQSPDKTGFHLPRRTEEGNRTDDPPQPRRDEEQGPHTAGAVTGAGAPASQPPDASSSNMEASSELLRRAKTGDALAVDRLFTRQLPDLRRWSSRRLPQWARDVADTADLVQEALYHAFLRLDRLNARSQGALRAYLRQAVINLIRDEVRRARRKPPMETADDQVEGRQPSPLSEVIGQERMEVYVAALARLRPEEQHAVVARVECGYSYEQIALVLGKASPDAARMAVSRALVRLAREMGHNRED
jgi:RNA polymerase sigma factor (sigma-70 family)